jgi:hypothetical protein
MFVVSVMGRRSSFKYLFSTSLSLELNLLKLSSKLSNTNLNNEISLRKRFGMNFNPLSIRLTILEIKILLPRKLSKLPIWKVRWPTL